MFVSLQPQKQKGHLAERLGTGLQNLLLRFESGSDLKQKERINPKAVRSLFVYVYLMISVKTTYSVA